MNEHLPEQPDKENVIRLLAAAERLFENQSATDVYNALVNLLGYTISQSAYPTEMLMITFQALAKALGIRTETVVAETDEEEERVRDKPLN